MLKKYFNKIKENKEEIPKYFFLVSMSVFFYVFFIGIVLQEEKQVVYAENRSAHKLPDLNVRSFVDGTYQSELELAVIDQLIASQTIKLKVIDFNNSIFNFSRKYKPNNALTLVVKSFYQFDDLDYLLYYPSLMKLINDNKTSYYEIASLYNSIDIEEKYFYLATDETGLTYDDKDENVRKNVEDFLSNTYNDFKTDMLDINNINDYMNYYYKNDHHWNHKGAYQAYKDIMNLMNEKTKILEPIEEVTFNYNASGSKSNTSRFYSFSEKFQAYKFDLPSFNIYTNGFEGDYGKEDYYFELKEKNKDNGNLIYGDFYGWDLAELIFQTERPKLENILIIGYSDTNSINKLIANHFNNTHVIDLRHVEDFYVNDYIKENKIDKLLIVGSPSIVGFIEPLELEEEK